MREIERKRVIIYNLPECKDSEADKLSVLSLVETVYSLKMFN